MPRKTTNKFSPEVRVCNRRLLEPIGNIPPAEAEEQYYAVMEQLPTAA